MSKKETKRDEHLEQKRQQAESKGDLNAKDVKRKAKQAKKRQTSHEGAHEFH